MAPTPAMSSPHNCIPRAGSHRGSGRGTGSFSLGEGQGHPRGPDSPHPNTLPRTLKSNQQWNTAALSPWSSIRGDPKLRGPKNKVSLEVLEISGGARVPEQQELPAQLPMRLAQPLILQAEQKERQEGHARLQAQTMLTSNSAARYNIACVQQKPQGTQ